MPRRRPLAAFLLLVLAAGLPGCFTVNIAAPPGPDVTVLPRDVPVEVTRRYQRWYAIFGIFPLSATSEVQDIIAREHLVQVRVYTEDSVEDSISGFFYTLIFPLGILLPQQVVVEGNRAPGTAATAMDPSATSLPRDRPVVLRGAQPRAADAGDASGSAVPKSGFSHRPRAQR